MGSFNNIILVDDWMAIQYDIVNTNRETGESKPGTTMEFARCRRPWPFYGCPPRTTTNEYGGSVDLLMTALIGQGKLNAKQLKSLYETLEQMEDDT